MSVANLEDALMSPIVESDVLKIPNLGQAKAKRLIEAYPTLGELLTATKKELGKLRGFSPELASVVFSWAVARKSILEEADEFDEDSDDDDFELALDTDSEAASELDDEADEQTKLVGGSDLDSDFSLSELLDEEVENKIAKLSLASLDEALSEQEPSKTKSRTGPVVPMLAEVIDREVEDADGSVRIRSSSFDRFTVFRDRRPKPVSETTQPTVERSGTVVSVGSGNLVFRKDA